jgi:hypothetical protein
MEITSTPSLTASSMALSSAELEHPSWVHTLYEATRLAGAPPLAVPPAWP